MFAILHGLLEKLEPKEDSSSDSKIIKEFKVAVAIQIVQRFELQSLHSAHPLLIGSLLDPRFKNITLSKYNKGEIKVLKDGLIELMEMVEEQATEEGSHGTTCTITTTTLSTLTISGSSATPPAAKKEKLTTLDKLLGPEQLS